MDTHEDFVDLRKQARENLKAHVQNRLPSDYEKCMVGMNEVLKHARDIANISKGVTNDNGQTIASTVIDRRQDYRGASSCQRLLQVYYDLSTNGVIVMDSKICSEHYVL